MTSLAQAYGRVGQGSSPATAGFRPAPGERILWQGRPDPGALRRHFFRTRWIVVYFAGLLLWKLALVVFVRGLQPQEVADTARLLVQGVLLIGIVTFFAGALARNTTYTVTDLRIVIRHGIALPGTVDIPLRALRSVAVRVRDDGTGDVALGVREGGGIGYAKLWPNVRGIDVSHPMPMLRGLTDAAQLGTMLTRCLTQLRDTTEDLDMLEVAKAVHAA